MEVKIKAIITNVGKSNKNNNQYINLFDLGSATQYTVVSRYTDFSSVPVAVPVDIEAKISPRQFPGSDGKSSTVLYVDQASIKKS